MKGTIKDLIPEWMHRMKLYYIIATDLEGRYTFVNDLFKSRFEYMGIDLIGKPFGITIHPDDVDIANQAAYQCITEPHKTVTIEIRKPRPVQGEFYWTQWEFSLLKDTNEEPIGIICIGNDITNTKRVTKKNDEFVSLFKDIGQNVPGIIYQFKKLPDGSFSFPYISNNTYKYFSLSPEDLHETADPILELIHPEDLHVVHESIEESTQNKSKWECTFRVVLKDGQTIWLEGKSKPKTLADGSLIWNGFFNDVTERQKIVEQIKASEKQLRSLLNLQTCYVLRLDMQGNYMYANKKYLDTFGFLYRDENDGYQYLGEDAVDSIHPDDVSVTEAAMEKLAKNPNKVFQADLRKPLENGGTAHTLWDFSFIFDSEGQPEEIQCVGIDYTERKKKEEQLKRSEYKLNAILNSTKEGNVLIDPNYKILAFNFAAQETAELVFGKSMNENGSILDFVTPETKAVFLKDSQKALKGEFVHREFKVKDYWFEFSFYPVLDEDDGLIGFSMNTENIDDRKRYEQELIEAKKDAEDANRAKSQFLANMSHELRTPLNGVIGFTQILSETTLTPVQQQYVDNANRSGHNLLKIINDLLNLSKIEAGMLELEFMRTDIIELIENTINVVKVAAAKKDIELILSIDPELPRFALTDTLRLTQILSNLLSNAVKFTKTGEVEFRVDYHPLTDDKGRILFSIRDTGIGITEEQKQKLFKAFSQADSSTTRKFGGTGLGLVISQMIAKKMNSQIEFESTPGKGSRFYFQLVLKTEKDHPENDTLTNTPSLQPNGSNNQRATILIAEDVPLNMDLITALLGSIQPHAKLIKAEDGQKAVERTKEEKPDIVLMDVQMPLMDGMEATRAIRKLERLTGNHTMIVALTAAAMKEDRQKCLDAGMDDVITKPINVNKLKRVIEQCKDISGG